MPAPTFVSYTTSPSPSGDATSKTTAGFDVQAGDLIVVLHGDETGSASYAATPITNSGTALTWTSRQVFDGDGTQGIARAWTAIADTNRTGMTVTVTMNTATTAHVIGAFVFRNAAYGTSNIANNGTGSGAPAVTLTTTAANSMLVCVNNDWNAQVVATTYRQINSLSPVEHGFYGTNGVDYAIKFTRYTDTGAIGSKTAGETSPSTQRYIIIAVEVVGESSGQSVPVGQVTESGTAQTIAPVVTRRYIAVGQVTESGTAQPVTHAKVAALGLVTESGTAQPVTASLGKITDHALPIDAVLTAPSHPVDLVTDTHTAQPVTHSRAYPVGQVATADTAQPVTHSRAYPVGQVTDAHTAQPVTWSKVHAVGLVAGTEAAQTITVRSALGIAAESDTALALTANKAYATGQVVAADTAQLIEVQRQNLVNPATEADAAQPIDARKAYAVATATTTDAALGAAHAKAKPVGQAVTTDVAQPVVGGTDITFATEADEAQAITARKTAPVGSVTQADVAQALLPRKTYATSQATEAGTAAAVTLAKARTLGVPTEANTIQAVRAHKTRAVATVATLCDVFPITRDTGQAAPAYVRPSATTGRGSSAGVRRGSSASISSGTSGAELP